MTDKRAILAANAAFYELSQPEILGNYPVYGRMTTASLVFIPDGRQSSGELPLLAAGAISSRAPADRKSPVMNPTQS
jgi:hypothetical protein